MEILSTALTLPFNGPFYAIAKSQLDSLAPLNSEKLWEFWTRSRSPLARLLVENYPPKIIADRLIG
jgi:hypothetical protein